MVRLQFNQGFYTHGARQQTSASGGDVVHANPYVILEQVVSTFINNFACKEKQYWHPP